MSNLLSGDVDLSLLLNKLGHRLEEIRVRALHNILSKIEHGLICRADLVQHQHLHIQLLEWFNHDKCSHQLEILQLIQQLTKHDSAVKQFLEIGAVDFLSKLRADSEDHLHPVIDDILASLLRLPNQDQLLHRSGGGTCIYQNHRCPVVQKEISRNQDEVGQPTCYPAEMRKTDVNRGYFPHSSTGPKKGPPTNDLVSSPNSDVGCVKGLTFSTFPWLPLTPTDRHVLISTNSSLCSPRPSLVLNSCEFISGVVLQDFPAEIFLQRPNITKSLLSLFGLKPLSVGDNSITLSAIKCLRELSTLLLSRHRFYHDPALYCPKQDFGSQTASSSSSETGRASCSTGQSTLTPDSRPSVVGRNEPRMRGDGRDGDSPSSVGSSRVVPEQSLSVSDTDSEDAIILQFSQLTLPEFATDVLFHVTPLLKTDDTEVFVASMYLLHEVVKLGRIAMTSEIWDDCSAAGRTLIDKMLDSFETLGEVIHYHYHECHGADDDDDGMSSLSVSVSDEAFIHHRLSIIAVVTLVKKLIQDLVPLAKVKDVLPESLSLSLYLAVMDQGLLYCTPDVRPFLLAVIQRSLLSKHRLYQQVASISNSMNSACMFLHEMDKKRTDVERLLDLAEASLRSLHYHRILTLVDKFVQLCSNTCSSSNEKLVRHSGRILLRFLASPEQDVRLQTYAACLKTVKDVINVQDFIKARSSATEQVHFLLDSKILYEICCFGLSDQEKVCSQAEDLILHLIQGQLLMSSTTWCVFLQACIPVLPILQAHVGKKSPLSACILGLLQPSASRSKSAEFEVLPKLEKLRGSLRLLLCQDQSVRLEGAKCVLYYLTQETCSSLKLPSVDSYTLNDIADLLLMDHAIHLDTHNGGRSVFQVDGLLQIFNIFTAANTEAGLRKSALEQIAIILQDVTLHKAFLSQGGLDKILDCMKKATTASTDEPDPVMLAMVPACFCILRHILHEDPLLRHQLAHQEDIYYLVIRGGLLCYTDCRARYHAAHVAVLLLFDEVASLSVAEDQPVNQFTLPACISQKYKLPFRCQTTLSHSSYRIEHSSTDDSLNKSSVAWKLLRIAWNVAWHGGIEGLMGKIGSGLLKEPVASFNSRLTLTSEDKLLLRCSHVPTSLSQCVQSVCDAPSHYAVKVSLWRLSGWLLTNMLMHNGVDINKDCPDVTQLLLQLEFKTALNRFIGVVPVSVDDKMLLTEVLSFLMLLMKSLALMKPPCSDFLHWLGNVASMPTSVLIGLLNPTKPDNAEVDGRDQADVGSSVQRMLHKQLVTFFGSYVQCLPLSSEAWRRKTGYLGGSLSYGLLLSLNSADAAHFYDLPSLENTLHSLVHVTARPGWSLDWKDGDSLSLCQHLLNSLLEVISSFHVGRGGTAMSYMGKGVTKSASMCLCHLAHEMANRAHQKNWSSEWLYTRQTQEGLSEIGLEWLIPLWSYRDPEVRAAGLGIATVLSSLDSGRVTMTKGCQHLPGGLWAVAFGVLLDQSECSIVRRQAALLLVNLMSEHLAEQDTDSLNSKKEAWVGPFVHDQQTQLCLAGVPALHAVLEHYNIYHGITASLYHFYGQASIQPVSVVEDSTVVSSSVASGLSTATTPDVGSSQSSSGRTSPDTAGQPNLMEEDHPQISSSLADSGGLSVGTSPAVQSNRGSSKSSSSYSSRPTLTRPSTTGRYISVVTPSLVAALSCLLRNLIAQSPHETIARIDKEAILKQLIRLVDVDGISNLLHHLTLSSRAEHSETYLQLSGHLTMCRDILRLYQAYKQAHQDQSNTTSVEDKSVFMLGCRLLGLSSTSATGSPIWQHIHDVWQCAYMLMLTQVNGCSHGGFQDLKPVIVGHWTVITAAIIHIVKSPIALSTRTVSLNFLASLLAKMHMRQGKEVWRKDDMQSCQDDAEEDGDDIDVAQVLDEERITDGCATSSGGRLCSVLLQAIDGTLARSIDNSGSTSERTGIICALRNLLAVSHQAKKTAVKSGLIESILDNVQHTHAKLNVECLQHPRPVSKKKEEPLLLQLISHMGLLQNCLCDSQEAKITSLGAGLTSVVLKLWSWCILDIRLLSATLSLLAVYTAHCTPACSSLSQCLPGQSGSSLLHRIIQQIDREKKQAIGQFKDNRQQTKGLFVLLSNVILAAECRNALWKSGFLQTFSQVCPERKRTSSRRSLSGKQLSAALWLQLLANLTLSTEGQQMVMRIPDALELLLLWGESTNEDVAKLATLTLHNLCFHSANKPKLLASEKLLPFFEKRLTSGRKSVQCMVVNALWALLYESQKAKAVLKSSSIFQCLLNAQSQSLISPHQPMTLPSNGQSETGNNSLYQAITSVLALMID